MWVKVSPTMLLCERGRIRRSRVAGVDREARKAGEEEVNEDGLTEEEER
jgi:hypothetical protein